MHKWFLKRDHRYAPQCWEAGASRTVVRQILEPRLGKFCHNLNSFLRRNCSFSCWGNCSFFCWRNCSFFAEEILLFFCQRNCSFFLPKKLLFFFRRNCSFFCRRNCYFFAEEIYLFLRRNRAFFCFGNCCTPWLFEPERTASGTTFGGEDLWPPFFSYFFLTFLSEILSKILLTEAKIRLYLPFSNWFGSKRTSVWL